MQAFFASNKPDEIMQASQFSQEFSVKMETLPQGPGTSGDYIIVQSKNPDYPLNTVIEFKNDKSSQRTGNLYLEYEQTSDNWFTGIELAISHGQIAVIRSGQENFIIKNHKEHAELVSRKHRTITTKAGANGNRCGCYTRGHLVKIKHARTLLDSFTTHKKVCDFYD